MSTTTFRRTILTVALLVVCTIAVLAAGWESHRRRMVDTLEWRQPVRSSDRVMPGMPGIPEVTTAEDQRRWQREDEAASREFGR